MRLVCLGCELENKPELCSFSRAKTKRLCITKSEKAHDSLHFPGSIPGWLLMTRCERSIATLFPETISFGQTSQNGDLLASSPSAFLNRHHSNSPAQQGFPAPGATAASTTAWNLTARKSPDSPRLKQEGDQLSKRSTPMFASGTSVWGSHQLSGLRASENLLSCPPTGWDTKLQAPGFKMFWPNGSQWGFGPFWDFPDKAVSVFLLWLVQCHFRWHSASAATLVFQCWEQVPNPIHCRATHQSFRWWAPEATGSTMLPAWKRHENPGPLSALSLEDESSPLNSIFGWNHNDQFEGLQGWKNLGSLSCDLHHLWAASAWLSKL